MYNKNIPKNLELPSTKKLLKSTILAAFGALLLLCTVVMPAEYGIDPTGVGRLTGLKTMGEIKMSLAKEAEAEELAKEKATAPQAEVTQESIVEEVKALPVPANKPSTSTEPSTDAALRKDTMTLTLQPNEGSEIKVDLKKGEVVKFVWSSNAGKANFDVHADSKKLDIDYHNYSKGSSTREEGTIEAAFDGSHGWFWRNRTGEPLTITLATEGPYTNIKKVK